MTRKTKLNGADPHALLSWCIQVTALLAEEYVDAKLCDPQLVESLRHMQMTHDRALRKLSRSGTTPAVFGKLPVVPSFKELVTKLPN